MIVLNVKSIPNWIPPDNPDGENGLADDNFDFDVSKPPDYFGVWIAALLSATPPNGGIMTLLSFDFPKLYYN